MENTADYIVPMDYLKFYDLEHYLFTEVRGRFARFGEISPADFYMIIVWKANLSRARIRNKLAKRAGSFAAAVEGIAGDLRAAKSSQRRLEILMKDWEFRLPTATAILTVLYPDEFSVYDVRVCEHFGQFRDLADRQFSETLWEDYQRYLEVVTKATPRGLSQRDKDRFLSGRSFYESVLKDLEESAEVKPEKPERKASTPQAPANP